MYLVTASQSGIPCSGFASAKFDNLLVKEITWNLCGIHDNRLLCDTLTYKETKYIIIISEKEICTFVFYQRQRFTVHNILTSGLPTWIELSKVT